MFCLFLEDCLFFFFLTKTHPRHESFELLPFSFFPGLFLYINGYLVAHEQTPRQTYQVRDDGTHKDFVIGRSNDHSGVHQQGTITVDDFSFMSEFKSEEDIRELGMDETVVSSVYKRSGSFIKIFLFFFLFLIFCQRFIRKVINAISVHVNVS